VPLARHLFGTASLASSALSASAELLVYSWQTLLNGTRRRAHALSTVRNQSSHGHALAALPQRFMRTHKWPL